MHLAEETRDGLELEMRLALNPVIRARREAWQKRVRDFTAECKSLSRQEMVQRLIDHNQAYIRELLETDPGLLDRYVMTFLPKADAA